MFSQRFTQGGDCLPISPMYTHSNYSLAQHVMCLPENRCGTNTTNEVLYFRQQGQLAELARWKILVGRPQTEMRTEVETDRNCQPTTQREVVHSMYSNQLTSNKIHGACSWSLLRMSHRVVRGSVVRGAWRRPEVRFFSKLKEIKCLYGNNVLEKTLDNNTLVYRSDALVLCHQWITCDYFSYVTRIL